MVLLTLLLSLWLAATANAECGDTRDVTQTSFLLCTPETGDEIHTIPYVSGTALTASDLGNFDSSRRTFVMMHGFNENGTDWPVNEEFNKAFNSAGSYNLIYVNWRCLATGPGGPIQAVKF